MTKNIYYSNFSKNCLFTIIGLVLYLPFSIGQEYCGTEYNPLEYQPLSSPCINMDIDEVPIKTIRVSFHIFQKDDGSENIQNDTEGNDYLDAIEWSMNYYMSNMPMFDYTTSSPYYSDSKIRYEIVATHFWQNTEMWKKGSAKTKSKGDSLYNFIMGQSISYKNTSVHLFMPGNFSGINAEFGGIACAIGCNDWSTTIGVYYKYINSSPTNRNHWEPAKNFCHELGHNFNLWHTFDGDNCSDTPPLSKWSTNNMMDYGDEKTLTQCQLSQMHKWLEIHSDIVKSGLPNYSISGQIDWSGGGIALNTSNFVPDREIEVELSAPGETYFTWTKTGGSGQWWANAGGFYAEIDIGTSNYISFKVETEANCNDVTEYFDFNYTGSFYKVYPNPVQNFLHVDLDYESLAPSNNKDYRITKHQINIYDQYKSLLIDQELGMNLESHSIDVSSLKTGLYLVELKNQYFTKVLKIQKL